MISSDVIKNSNVNFGTSGARGLVEDFSPDVCAAFTFAFISVIKKRIPSTTHIALAIDNRPSSYGIAMACAQSILSSGLEPVYYGVIPTPALAFKAMSDYMPCIMVTGSHIPFDRNGLKFYFPDGEITKNDENDILSSKVEFSSLTSVPDMSPDITAGTSYIERYTSLFSPSLLLGKKIGIYEHSSAGRDLYKFLFRALGAEVISIGRSNEFVPIDTEAVSDVDIAKAKNWSDLYKFDMIFSTDGDGDRPLVADENGSWLRGDILGVLCAKGLGIKNLVVPISCNTAIEASNLFDLVIRTKIGSPYVIEKFNSLLDKSDAIAGFEANGGFLLGSNITVNGSQLAALPTRDAVLPALILLASAGHRKISSLVNNLPQRFTLSDRIKNFATHRSNEIIERGKRSPQELVDDLELRNCHVKSVDNTDGLRIMFDSGDIIHLRPSGNAPELRCYAESDSIEACKHFVTTCLRNIQLM